MTTSSPMPQEIIIVRRTSDNGDGGHHGGAWKIAYADFVTAMMAFFLVMWLVNSANEVTKSRVASYFNPIKMTDASPSPRGLKTVSDTKLASQPTTPDAAKENQKNVNGSSDAESDGEKAMLDNPLDALEKIVEKAEKVGNEKQSGVSDGRTVDPFNPKAWTNLSAEEATIQTKAGTDTAASTRTEPAEMKQVTKPHGSADAASAADADDAGIADLRNTVNQIVARHRSELDISVDIRRTDEGLLIMLGDRSGQGMFPIGSAKPGAALVDVVGVIGKLLSEQSGSVVVRGHTDGRKYRRGSRDNWQLSTARAHMASYMLMRGGLAEDRIKRIEGYGSALPLVSSRPFDDSNRRVEFLLQAPTTPK
jgi:chemotaxis protein MotB